MNTTEPTIIVNEGDDPSTIHDLATRATACFTSQPFTRTNTAPWDETPADALVTALSDAGLDIDYGLRPTATAQPLAAQPLADYILADIAQVIRQAEHAIDPH